MKILPGYEQFKNKEELEAYLFATPEPRTDIEWTADMREYLMK